MPHFEGTVELLAYLMQMPQDPCPYNYLVSQAEAGEALVTGFVTEADGAEKIAIAAENSLRHGYAGTEQWTQWITESGFPKSDVIPIAGVTDELYPVGDGRRFNTATEMTGVVGWLQANPEIKSIRIWSPSFHVLRSTVSFATAAETSELNCQVVFTGVNVGHWNKTMTHSQGTQRQTLADIHAAEIAKVAGADRYKNLLPPTHALEVLVALNE